jgi:hypothetical protein
MYPEWAVRRFVAHELLMEAGRSDRKVNTDLVQTLNGHKVPDEDPDLNEAFDRLLRTHHLTEPFQILVDGFTA